MLPADWASKREETREVLREAANKFNASRGEYKYAVGNEPTFVDFYMYEFLTIFRLYDMSLFTTFPKLVQYFANLCNLPGMYEYEEEQTTKGTLPVPAFTAWMKDGNWTAPSN
jgi:glutathione S-transferase